MPIAAADALRVQTTPMRLISLRWPGQCASCAREIPRGTKAWHDPSTRSVRCCGCTESSSAAVPRAGVASVAPPNADANVIDAGVAGRGARREYERLRRKRETDVRERYGKLGVVVARVASEPQHIAAWKTGAEGEERLARRLEKHLADKRVTLLHDRRIPPRVANLDHLAIGPGGVTVIDAKNYKGEVRVVSEGGLFSPRVALLRIDGRNKTDLVDGVEGQVREVEAGLADAGLADIPVVGALCFVKTDGLPVFGRCRVRDVALVGPRGAARLAARSGELDADAVREVTAILAKRFPAS